MRINAFGTPRFVIIRFPANEWPPNGGFFDRRDLSAERIIDTSTKDVTQFDIIEVNANAATLRALSASGQWRRRCAVLFAVHIDGSDVMQLQRAVGWLDVNRWRFVGDPREVVPLDLVHVDPNILLDELLNAPQAAAVTP